MTPRAAGWRRHWLAQLTELEPSVRLCEGAACGHPQHMYCTGCGADPAFAADRPFVAQVRAWAAAHRCVARDGSAERAT